MAKNKAFKISRRLGFSILETGKEFSKGKKRAYGPGQHGAARKKDSNYAIQLKEKQKVRHMYGMSEKQFRKTYVRATKMDGITGENFLKTLESRLDNIVYRMKLAGTRRAARQLVSHGHIRINGKKANIPSMNVNVGDEISLKSTSLNNKAIKEALELPGKLVEFVSFDQKSMKGTYTRLPDRKELNKEINESLIVEWYNRMT